MQNRVALPVTLAGFAQRAAEDELLPQVLPVLGTSVSRDLKKKIATELAIGIVACVRMPDKRALDDVWALEGEALRQMVAMLIFSENSDSRQVLENARYSSSPHEARVQVLLSIARLVGSKDDTLITRINTQAFGKAWSGFAADFVDGAVTGFKRAQRQAVIESLGNRLESLSPRGQALIEELVRKCAEAPGKPQPNASNLLAPNNRAQILYKSAQRKAEELRNQITPMMGLPGLDIPELQKMNEGLRSHWLSICIPYAVVLLFLSQLKKDAYFAKSDEFVVIYGQTVLRMAALQKQDAGEMGFLEKFDQNRAEATAKKELGEMEEAMLFYIDFFNKIPFPDQNLLNLFMAKIGIADNLRSKFSARLREFNTKTLAEFADL